MAVGRPQLGVSRFEVAHCVHVVRRAGRRARLLLYAENPDEVTQLSAPIFCSLLAAVAWSVFADRFPSPMPVHWDMAGRPNGCFPRTPLAMAFPLLLIGGILLLLDGIVASGARTGPPAMTEAVRRMLAPDSLVLGLMAIPAAFAPLWGPTPVLVCAGAMVVVVLGKSPVRRGWRRRWAMAGGGPVLREPGGSAAAGPEALRTRMDVQLRPPPAWVIFAALLLGPLLVVVLSRCAPRRFGDLGVRPSERQVTHAPERERSAA